MRKEVGEASRIRMTYPQVVGIASATSGKYSMCRTSLGARISRPDGEHVLQQLATSGNHWGPDWNLVNPLDGQDISLTNIGNDRPNVVGNPHLSNRTTHEWFNTAAYAKQATGTFGNAGSYSIEGPESFTFDTELSRAFKVRESQTWRCDSRHLTL